MLRIDKEETDDDSDNKAKPNSNTNTPQKQAPATEEEKKPEMTPFQQQFLNSLQNMNHQNVTEPGHMNVSECEWRQEWTLWYRITHHAS